MATRKKAKSKAKAKKAKKSKARKPVVKKKVTKKKKKKVATRRAAPKKKPAAKKKVAKKKKPAAKKKTVAKKKPAAKKPPAPKPMVPAVAKLPTPPALAGEERVGIVTHYYTHLGVAIVQMETGSLREGDTIHIKGHTSDFRQRAESMEIEHVHVPQVMAGQVFGLRVKEHAREHDVVYKVRSF